MFHLHNDSGTVEEMIPGDRDGGEGLAKPDTPMPDTPGRIYSAEYFTIFESLFFKFLYFCIYAFAERRLSVFAYYCIDILCAFYDIFLDRIGGLDYIEIR